MFGNVVPFPPSGLVIALQYYAGDEGAAMRVARLIADLEPARRDDVLLAFCRRHDTPQSRLSWDTQLHCGFKFGTMAIQSERKGEGFPAGPNGLWSGTMDALARAWRSGKLPVSSVFCCEPDGVPLRRDWIGVLKAEHARTLRAGKRVTGPWVEHPIPHFNGTFISHLSLWWDRPSLHETPAEQAWDLFHAHVLASEGQATGAIKNIYGAVDWTPGALAALARETAWLTSTKDTSAIAWAERTLVERPGTLGPEEVTPAPRGPMSCSCPDPYRCKKSACPCRCSLCAGAGRRVTVKG